MFVNKQKAIYQADEGNVITIGLDTQTVFYQENPFYTGQNIQILRNKQIYCFIYNSFIEVTNAKILLG